MQDETMPAVDFIVVCSEANKKVKSIIERVNDHEDRLGKITTEFVTSLQSQMNEIGITEQELDDTDFNQAARTIFFESPRLETDDNQAFQEIEAKYPKLVALFKVNHDQIMSLHGQHSELVEIKKQALPELHVALEEEYNQIISHVDYEAGLSSESMYEFIYDMCTLTDIVTKPDSNEDEYEFDRKKWAHERSKQIVKKLTEENLIKITENTPPTESETNEAKKALLEVKKTVKKIEFHNDLVGFIKTRGYIDTPPITKIVSRLPTSKFSTASIQKFAENLFLENELGKMVKVEKANLELIKKTTWLDVVDTELIYSIIEKVDTQNANLVGTIRNAVIADIFQRYQELFGKSPSNRGENPNSLNVDQYFVDLIKDFTNELGPMTPLDKRVLNSQMVALHFLFMSHGIDRIYEKYLSRIPPNEAPQTKQQELKAKSVLAMDFLRKNAKKNKEAIIARKNIDAPTVGIEYEYADRLEGLLTGDPNIQAFIDQLNIAITKRKDSGGDSASDESMLKLLEGVQETTLKNSRQVLYGDRDFKPSVVQQLSMVDLLTTALTVTNNMSQLGTFTEDISHSPFYREIITEPSISYRMQMREIVQTMSRGSLDGSLNPHFTVGNVELTPEKPEASEFRVWLMASGLVDNDEIVEDDSYVRGEEKFWKLTSFNDKRYYLPFHHVRNGPEMKRYNTKYKPYGFEIRTFTSGTGENRNFTNHIRALSLVSSASFGLQAYQKDPVLRSKKEQSLAKLYENLVDDWKRILTESNVDFLPMDKRFAEVEIESVDNDRQLKYLDETTKYSYRKYMTEVQKARNTNPEFSEQVKKALRNYRKKANKLIGY